MEQDKSRARKRYVTQGRARNVFADLPGSPSRRIKNSRMARAKEGDSAAATSKCERTFCSILTLGANDIEIVLSLLWKKPHALTFWSTNRLYFSLLRAFAKNSDEGHIFHPRSIRGSEKSETFIVSRSRIYAFAAYFRALFSGTFMVSISKTGLILARPRSVQRRHQSRRCQKSIFSMGVIITYSWNPLGKIPSCVTEISSAAVTSGHNKGTQRKEKEGRKARDKISSINLEPLPNTFRVHVAWYNVSQLFVPREDPGQSETIELLRRLKPFLTDRKLVALWASFGRWRVPNARLGTFLDVVV